MTMHSSGDLVRIAYKNGYAVPAINTNGGTDEIVQACVQAAENKQSPLLLAVYRANANYRGLDEISRRCKSAIEQATVPMALHLDHGKTIQDMRDALDAGFPSIMCDLSHHPLEENIKGTQEILEMARPLGATVEAEVGQLVEVEAGKSVLDYCATVEDSVKLMQAAPVDMLAVAIGNAHGFYKSEPEIQFDRLEAIHKALPDVPLVMHGCTGLPDESVRRTVGLGVAKVNFGALLRTRWVEFTREEIDRGEDVHQFHPWRVLEKVRDRLVPLCEWIIDLCGSEGKAADAR